ncbi:MAG: hypothetical protein JWL59_3491 [Chthoniobacteraceae bacterium]|nr:hypothetical protein [Chthoniobacteraceae bacterium]
MTGSPELHIGESLSEQAGSMDAALVRDALAGDARASEQIVATYHRRVFNFIHQMTKQRQDAEDLTQQTFIRAFANLSRFEPGRPLINWLLTIARHGTLNHFRAARSWEVVPENIPAIEPSPASIAAGREEAENIWDRARTILPRRQFEVLWLRFGEELSVKETAQVVGLTQTHVKILVFRARRLLLKGELLS